MHRLKDFKNFQDASLNLFEPLTILLGRNGAGKTNLIEGVELMAALARGVPINEVTDVGRGGALEVRGGLPSCGRFGTASFELRLDEAVVAFEGRQDPIDYAIRVATDDRTDAHLAAETLKVGHRVLFHARSEDGEIFDVQYDNLAPGRNPRCRLSTSSSVLSRYDEVVANSKTVGKGLRSAKRTVAAVTEYLRGSYTFDPIAKFMRNYERVSPQLRLLRNGSNLSAVLFALSERGPNHKDALQRITKTIRQIPEEPFSSVGFVKTQLGDVMAGLRMGSNSGLNGGRLMDARLLSDGTLRMLAVLTALETVPKRSRIVIEEFDNSLHPSRAKLLVQHLATTAEKRKLNVLLTTHNSACMDALDEEQLKNVWICHRDSARKSSKVTRLIDLDELLAMGITGSLGDFVTRGTLENRLAASYSEDRQKAMRHWIESVS